MNLQISTTSMIPIYEQISDQIRHLIKEGRLNAGDGLPSVRAVAREHHISALTVKKAYDLLESEGFVCTVQGKGSYVAAISPNLVAEEMQRQAEAAFETAIEKAQNLQMTNQEILELVTLLLEDNNDTTD